MAQPPAGKARIRFVYNHPRFGNHHAIDELYATLVDAVPAKGVIRIETAYFAPSELLRGRLRAAIARGTGLAVISNLEANDTAPVAEGTGSSTERCSSSTPRRRCTSGWHAPISAR